MADNMIIYQIALRTFTPDGTLKAAEKLLPFVKSLGVDVVYLCPVFKAGNDEDKATWSARQIASKTENPKNPYKMSDYFNVDEEYGTNDDLKEFVKEAHLNGLKVLFDLVYLHCDKNAVFIKDNPDFVLRNEDGAIKVGDGWPFARLNFENPELRKYLLSNMETFIKEYGADGFRCDVGDNVPLDFWKNSFEYLKKIKPDLITLNEGSNPEYVKDVFDMEYGFSWNTLITEIFRGTKDAGGFASFCENEKRIYKNDIYKILRTIDNHDFASDSGKNRNEIVMTSKGVEAATVINNTYCGVPFIWNGYEVCDDAENSMFSNRFYGKRSAINWSKAFTEDGQKRLEFIREIHRLRHLNEVFYKGECEMIDNDCPKDVISYLRRSKDTKAAVIVNTKNKPVDVKLDINIVKIYKKSDAVVNGRIAFGAYGYIIAEIS